MIKNTDNIIQKYLTPFKWEKPVLTGSGLKGAFDEKAVDIPFVFWHQGLFHMMYTGFDGISYQSALAVSNDLIHWSFKGMVTERRSDSSRWDKIGAAGTWMIKESDDLRELPKLRKIDGKYWMVYHSYPQEGYEEGPAELGLAWTEDEDLLNWNFPEQPFFSWKDGADWERGGLYKACIVQKDGRWYLFYNAKNQEMKWIEQTGLAVSDDFVHWKRVGKEPVLKTEPGTWDWRFVSDPCVLRDGELWLNFYFGFDGEHAQEGLAVSKDLIHWEKVEGPILEYGEEKSFDSRHAHKASVLMLKGNLYHFYCGVRPWQEGDPTSVYDEFRTIMAASSRSWDKQESE